MRIPEYLKPIILAYEKKGGYKLQYLMDLKSDIESLPMPDLMEYYKAQGYIQAMQLKLGWEISKMPKIIVEEKEVLSQALTERLAVETEKIVRRVVNEVIEDHLRQMDLMDENEENHS